MRQNRSKDKSESEAQDYSDVLELVEQLAKWAQTVGINLDRDPEQI